MLNAIYYNIFPIIYWMLTIGITIRIITKKLSVSQMISWLIMVYLLPFIGIIAYIILGEVRLSKKRELKFKEAHYKYNQKLLEFNSLQRAHVAQIKSKFKPIFFMCQKSLRLPALKQHKITLLTDSHIVFSNIKRDIRHAKTSINMEFYILLAKGAVLDVLEELKAAKKRGVEINILLDDVGSRPFFKSLEYKELTALGINIDKALKTSIWGLFLSRIDIRQHRKLIIIDNYISYTGSMNLADPRYFKAGNKAGMWVDLMLRMEGVSSNLLNLIFSIDLGLEKDEIEMPEICNYQAPVLQNSVQVLASGPGFDCDLLTKVMMSAFYMAEKEITIVTPYFVPSHDIAQAICTAANRGVKVTLVVPKTNDSLMVKWASRCFFDDLLKAGVKIYEYTQGLMHSKAFLIDRELTILGSINLDQRSFKINFELSVLMEDKKIAEKTSLLVDQYINKSILLNRQQWQARPYFNKIIEKIFFLFSPLL